VRITVSLEVILRLRKCSDNRTSLWVSLQTVVIPFRNFISCECDFAGTVVGTHRQITKCEMRVFVFRSCGWSQENLQELAEASGTFFGWNC
jgi:hypothetical protein